MSLYREDPCVECDGKREVDVWDGMGGFDREVCKHCKGTGQEPRGTAAMLTGSEPNA